MPEAANPARTEPNCGHQREGVGFEPTEPRDGASGFKPVALDPKSRLAGASAYRRVLLDLVRGDSEGSARTLWLSAGTDSKAAATERLATGSSSGPLARWRSR